MHIYSCFLTGYWWLSVSRKSKLFKVKRWESSVSSLHHHRNWGKIIDFAQILKRFLVIYYEITLLLCSVIIMCVYVSVHVCTCMKLHVETQSQYQWIFIEHSPPLFLDTWSFFKHEALEFVQVSWCMSFRDPLLLLLELNLQELSP